MSYAPIVAPADLYTQMYPEVRTLITRGDDTIPAKAISSAIKEVKMYLSRFDLVALFGDPVADTAATINDEFLIDLVKSIATWHLLRLANPNVDLTIARTWYEDAISSLKKITLGTTMPEGWPYRDTTGETAAQGDSIYFTPGKCRDTHF